MKESGAFGCMVVVLSVIAVFWLFDWAPWSSDITIYPAMCEDEEVPFEQCESARLLPLNRSSFQVDMAGGTVLYRFNDQPGLSLTRLGFTGLKDCKITDVENWRCSYSDGSGQVSFTNGRIFRTGLPKHIAYVGALRWWWLLLSSNFR